MFGGSDRGGQRAAAMYSLIISALCSPPNYAERLRNNARLSRYSRLYRGYWVRSMQKSNWRPGFSSLVTIAERKRGHQRSHQSV